MSDSYGSGDDRDRGGAEDDSPYGGSGYPPYGGSGQPPVPGYPQPPQGPGGYPPPPPGGQWPPAQPGYPAYGGPGYPGGPWDTERPRGWSGLAIAAFLVGLLVPCLGLIVAIPLGIAALVTIRKSGEKGKALAWLGIVIPVLWLGLFGAAIAWFVSTDADRNEAGVIVEAGRLDYGDIRVGDCVAIDGLGDDTELGAFDIEGVPCADEHNAEVASTVDLNGDEYPGEAEVRRQAGAGCAPAQTSVPQGLDIYPLYPTEALWDDDGGRQAICFAVRGDYSDMTGKQLN